MTFGDNPNIESLMFKSKKKRVQTLEFSSIVFKVLGIGSDKKFKSCFAYICKIEHCNSHFTDVKTEAHLNNIGLVSI